MKPSEIFETPEASGFDRVNTHQQPSSRGWEEEFEDKVAEALGYKMEDGEWKTYDFYGNLERITDDTRLKDVMDAVKSLLTSYSQAIRERVETMSKPELCPKYPNGGGECNQRSCSYCKLKENEYRDGYNQALDDVLALLNDKEI